MATTKAKAKKAAPKSTKPKTPKTRNGQPSFQERLKRGMRKLAAAGWDLRTVEASEIMQVSRGLIRGKNAKETASLKKAFDVNCEKSSAPVAVSIAKRSYNEDGTGCEVREGKGRPSYKELGVEAA